MPSGGGSVAVVLAIHDAGRALRHLRHLRFADDAVAASSPYAARDAQRRAVLHQAEFVDVGHLGAADALVDPAHDIAENALRVVVEFALDVLRRPVAPGGNRDRQDVVQLRLLARLQHFRRFHVDLVIVRGVQRGGGGRRNPGGVRASLRMTDLLLQHGGRQVRHGPYALAHGPAGRIPARYRRSTPHRLRREIVDELAEAGPEIRGFDAGAALRAC